jgi:hypothetical protein
MSSIPFQTIDLANISKVSYPGETGTAYWQTHQWNIEPSAQFNYTY